jgi:hypothetical protein
MFTPTTSELKESFHRCGLWRFGWTYTRAISVPVIAKAISCSAKAHRARCSDAPLQSDLFAGEAK